MKPKHLVVKPRATAEAARDPHVAPTRRTRHAIGRAAAAPVPRADVEATSDGDEWLPVRPSAKDLKDRE